MIKIKSVISEELKEYYHREMLSIIRSKYDDVKIIGNIGSSMEVVLSSLFEDENGKFNLNKAREVLTEPFSDKSRNSNLFFDNYYKCSMFLFYNHTALEMKLKNEKPLAARREKRKEYIASFANEWLNKQLVSNPDYFQSNEKAKVLFDDVRIMMNDINNQISRLIDYSSLSSELRHELLSSINVNVCPYCNRQYTTSYKKDAENRTMAYLDHFYPKSKFQLYSLSLYNFIPSCANCNSRFKIDRNIDILFPYEQGFDDDAYFKVVPTAPFDIKSLIGTSNEFEIDIHVNEHSTFKDKIEGNIEMFELKSIYQSHKQYVRDLLYKTTAYSPKYKKMLNEVFDEKMTELQFRLFLFGYTGSESELHNKPLSKLTNDILRDYDF